MKGITFRQRNTGGALSFDLKDILRVIGDRARHSAWNIRNLECSDGDPAARLYQLEDSGEQIAGHLLMDIAEHVGQVIDGEFVGYLPGESEPWVTIRAVDSSAWDVESVDDMVLRALSEHFSDTAPLPVQADT
jgi:diaminopimelate decarboxylase